MHIALKLVVNCKFDIIIHRTQCNYMTWLLVMTWLLCVYIYIYIYKLWRVFFTIGSFTNILSINELSYRRSKTSFGCVNVREILKVTKCIGVNSFVRVSVNMVCELKITSWSKKNCVKISW